MEDVIKFVRAGYDRWAPIYDHDGNPLQGMEGPAVQAAISDPRGLSVLDLGCGTGRHALWLASGGATVTAVDFSEGMLAEAQRKPGAEAIYFIKHDLRTSFPFPAESFDLVVSGLVLEHLADLDQFFSEIRRVLKRGGRGVISAMHPAMHLREAQARFTDPESGELVKPGSIPHRLGTFVLAALRAGLRITEIGEFAADADFATRYPRAARYIGWPMLVVIQLTA